MNTVSVSLSAELYEKLQHLSQNNGCSVEESLKQAVAEYIENNEFSSDLNSVSLAERSFFFQAAE